MAIAVCVVDACNHHLLKFFILGAIKTMLGRHADKRCRTYPDGRAIGTDNTSSVHAEETGKFGYRRRELSDQRWKGRVYCHQRFKAASC